MKAERDSRSRTRSRSRSPSRSRNSRSTRKERSVSKSRSRSPPAAAGRRSRSPAARRRVSRSRSPAARRKNSRSRSNSRSKQADEVDRRYNSKVDSTGKQYKQCGERSNVIGVFNMNFDTSDRKLERELEKFGRVERVVIVQRRDSRRSAGYGFVTFEKEEDAEAAVKKMNGTQFDGREIRVDYSYSKTRSTGDRPSGGDRPKRSDSRERRRSPAPRSRNRRSPSPRRRRRSRSRSRGRY